MSTRAFSIREYEAADETAVLALLRQSLGSDRTFNRTSAFWRWKHFQSPFGPSLMMVAENTDIVGLRAFMTWRFRAGDATLRAVRAVDTATHPGWRRGGVFSTLTGSTVERARAAGIDLIFNTPNRYSLPGYLKLGWTYVGRPRLLVKILRPLRVLRALARRPGPGDRVLGEPPSIGPGVPVSAMLDHPGAVERLLAEDDRQCGDAIRTDRSVSYLRWRYVENPELPYGACWRGSEPSGAAVIYRPNRRRGLGEVLLCEVLITPEGAGDLPLVVRDLSALVQGDYLIASAPRGSGHWRALRRAGFLPVPGLGPSFTVHPLSPAALVAAPARLDRWHLSLGDLELF